MFVSIKQLNFVFKTQTHQYDLLKANLCLKVSQTPGSRTTQVLPPSSPFIACRILKFPLALAYIHYKVFNFL